MSYEDYEKMSEEIQNGNKVLLEGFEKYLLETGLKEKTVNSHVSNIDFYINEYLLRDDSLLAKDGISSINGFFNWFFPRKVMWSNISSTKSNVASIKKFYKYMLINHEITSEEYQWLLSTIKEKMAEWLSHYENECYF